jgi:hypothetical protein
MLGPMGAGAILAALAQCITEAVGMATVTAAIAVVAMAVAAMAVMVMVTDMVATVAMVVIIINPSRPFLFFSIAYPHSHEKRLYLSSVSYDALPCSFWHEPRATQLLFVESISWAG